MHFFELKHDVKIFSFYKQGQDIAYGLNENDKIDYLYHKSKTDTKKKSHYISLLQALRELHLKAKI